MCFNLPLPVGPLFLINVIPVTCVLFTLRTASELVGALAEFIAMARVFNLPLPVGPLFLINVIPVTLCPFHLTNSLRAGWCPGRFYSNGTDVQLMSGKTYPSRRVYLAHSLRAGWFPGRVYSNGTGVQLMSGKTCCEVFSLVAL
jgi:hypothetical protein